MKPFEYLAVVKAACKKMLEERTPTVNVQMFSKDFCVKEIYGGDKLEVCLGIEKSFEIDNPLQRADDLLEFDDIFRILDDYEYTVGFWKPTKAYLPNVGPEGMTCFDLRNFNFQDMLVYGKDDEIIGEIINCGDRLDRSKL